MSHCVGKVDIAKEHGKVDMPQQRGKSRHGPAVWKEETCRWHVAAAWKKYTWRSSVEKVDMVQQCEKSRRVAAVQKK